MKTLKLVYEDRTGDGDFDEVTARVVHVLDWEKLEADPRGDATVVDAYHDIVTAVSTLIAYQGTFAEMSVVFEKAKQ